MADIVKVRGGCIVCQAPRLSTYYCWMCTALFKDPPEEPEGES